MLTCKLTKQIESLDAGTNESTLKHKMLTENNEFINVYEKELRQKRSTGGHRYMRTIYLRFIGSENEKKPYLKNLVLIFLHVNLLNVSLFSGSISIANRKKIFVLNFLLILSTPKLNITQYYA